MTYAPSVEHNAPSPARSGRPRKISPAMAEEIRQRYLGGTSVMELSIEHEIVTGTVFDILMCQNAYARDPGAVPVKKAAPRYQGNKRITDDHVHAIRYMRNKGLSYEGIAFYFKIATTTAINVAQGVGRFGSIPDQDLTPRASQLIGQESPCAHLAEPSLDELLATAVQAMIRDGKQGHEIVAFIRTMS